MHYCNGDSRSTRQSRGWKAAGLLRATAILLALWALSGCQQRGGALPAETTRDPLASDSPNAMTNAALEYCQYQPGADDIVLPRAEYAQKLQGFWLGQRIANWTGLEQAFGRKLADKFNIHRTRGNFPDNGIDSFPAMAERGVYVVDRVVQDEMGGGVDLANDLWYIPDPRSTPAEL